jgi:hypothetical protein
MTSQTEEKMTLSQAQTDRGCGDEGFTPGPWCIEDPMAPESLWIVQADKETYEWFPIAICDMPDEEDHLFTGKEVWANARLIAALPEQHAALNYVADMTYCGADAEWHFKPGYNPQVVLDAIAKAIGAPTADTSEGRNE